MHVGALAFTCAFIGPVDPVQAQTGFEITIDPGDFAGNYYFPSGGWAAGPRTVSLEPGMYSILLGHAWSPQFEVDASGNVISNVDAFTGGTSLTFNTQPVDVNVGGLTAYWRIAGASPWSTTSENDVQLVVGLDWQVDVTNFQTDFVVNVDSGGNVTSQNSGAAAGSLGALTFNNHAVNIRPQAYVSSWYLGVQAPQPRSFGDSDLVLPGGLHYLLGVEGSVLSFDLDAAGSLSSADTVSFDTVGNELRFKNTPIQIVTNGYEGYWAISSFVNYHNDQVIQLVPGTTNRVQVLGHTNSGNRIFVYVDSMGDATVLSKPESAVASGNVVTFQTAPMVVDPADYTEESYGFFLGEGWWGEQPVTFVRGQSGAFLTRARQPVRFHFDANGSVSSLVPARATGSGNRLTFETAMVTFTPPADPLLRWSVYTSAAKTGAQPVGMILGCEYDFVAWAADGSSPTDQLRISVDNPCAVNPAIIELASGTYTATCGSLDGDEDGVADEDDNCVDTPNADQLDQDEDGSGDACDDDLDGDGVLNANDNCVDSPNADQADFDGDGAGDECDDDADADGVNDSSDNCLGLANPSQDDGDGDGEGDACDVDDDDDLVFDEDDNCRTIPNADQADFDLDGEGDACDGDTDGDLVPNADDSCPETPLTAPGSPEGCSGHQLVGLRCPPDDFVKHGKYVSCVSHAATEAKTLGLFDNKERGRIVSNAARSN